MQCRGCEAACPSSRARSGTSWRAPARRSRDATAGAHRPLARRVAEWLGYRRRAAAPLAPRRRSRGSLLVGQRLHLVPRRLGLPTLSSAVAAHARSRPTPAPPTPTSSPAASWTRGSATRTGPRSTGHARPRARASALPGRGGDCCGALHVHAGRIGRGAPARPPGDRGRCPATRPIVVDSAGCGAAMKDYGRLLGTPEAHAFSARVRDFSEWVADAAAAAAARPRARPSSCRTRATSATCSGPQGAVRTRARARRTDCVDTADDGLCCGAGGAYTRAPARARRARSATARSRRSAPRRRRRAAPAGRRLGEPRLRDAPRSPPGSTCATPRSCSPTPSKADES